jgi:hypothetical protein
MTDRIAFKSAGLVPPQFRNRQPTAEVELSEAMRYIRAVKQDEAFMEAMLIAHPHIHVGVRTEPCTDNPQPVLPPAPLRSAHGFDYQEGD